MFRFTIRDVLWLTVVAAMAAAWWIDHQRLKKDYWITVPDGQFRAGLRTGEKVELEVLPNGQIRSRIVPATTSPEEK